MATKSPVACITSIGEVAGTVWRILSDNGPMPMAKLVKAVGAPRDTTMQALGWLAREDKVSIVAKGPSHEVSLR
jgi:hypothetical protein